MILSENRYPARIKCGAGFSGSCSDRHFSFADSYEMARAAGQAFRRMVSIVRINRVVTGKNNARSSPKLLLHPSSACSALLFSLRFALHQTRCPIFCLTFPLVDGMLGLRLSRPPL